MALVSKQRLLLCDYFNELVLLANNKGEVVSYIHVIGGVCGICMVQDDKAAVALAAAKKVQYVTVKEDRLTPIKSMRTSGVIVSLCAVNDTLAVLYLHPPAVEIISLEGNFINRIDNKIAEREILKFPRYLMVSPDYQHIFVTDGGTNTVIMLNTKLQLLKTFSYPNLLKLPYGITMLGNNQLLITSQDGNTINHLEIDAKSKWRWQMAAILDGKDGMDRPSALAFCHRSNILYIANDTPYIKRYIHQK